MSEVARTRGIMDRRAGKKLSDNPYSRQPFVRYWIAGWEEADAQEKAADFTNLQNRYSLLNPKNPFRR